MKTQNLLIISGTLLALVTVYLILKKKNGDNGDNGDNGVNDKPSKDEEAQRQINDIEAGITNEERKLMDIVSEILNVKDGYIPGGWTPAKDGDTLWDARCEMMVFGKCITSAGTNEGKLLRALG